MTNTLVHMEKDTRESAEKVMNDKRRDNISTIFLLPCLQIRDEVKARFKDFGFVNTYLFCDKFDYNFNPIYILFRPSSFDLEFYKFILQLEKNQNHIETMDFDKNSVLMTFRIPKRFNDDYGAFLRGRYSKFSPEFKKCFSMKDYVLGPGGELLRDEHKRYRTDYSMFYHIFNRTETLRNIYIEKLGSELPENIELYDRYKTVEETLTI